MLVVFIDVTEQRHAPPLRTPKTLSYDLSFLGTAWRSVNLAAYVDLYLLLISTYQGSVSAGFFRIPYVAYFW